MISSRLVPQTTATWVDHDLRSKETLISTPVIHMNSYPGFLTGMISNNLSSGGANCMMQSKWHRPVLSGQCPSFWRQTHRKSRQPPSVPRHRWIELARIQMFNYIFVVLVHWLYWLYCITEESQTSPGSLKTELNHVVFIDHGLPPSNWITLDHAGSRLIMRYMYIDIIVYTWCHIYMIGTLQIHVPTLHVFFLTHASGSADALACSILNISIWTTPISNWQIWALFAQEWLGELASLWSSADP